MTLNIDIQVRSLGKKDNKMDNINITSQDQTGIADMQCWVFRKAQVKWHKTPAECADIFAQYDLLGFIAECYELLHVSSYNHALNEVEEVLKCNEVEV